MQLKRNLSKLDQVLRIGIGILLIYFGFFSPDSISDRLIALVVGMFGIVNVVVGLIGCCPIYFLAGVSTLPENLASPNNSSAE